MLSLRRKFDPITAVLKDLHWLPVEQSIECNIKCGCSPIKLFVAKPLHTSPSCCLYIHQTGDYDQRPKFVLQLQDGVWKGLADALRILLNRFRTLYLHLFNVPLPLTHSKAAWRLTCLTWHILNPLTLILYIVKYTVCDNLVFSTYKFFKHSDLSPFWI